MKRSAEQSNMLKRIDVIFGCILVWSVVSTTLLIRKHHYNEALQRKLTALDKVKNFVGKKVGKKPKQEKAHKNIRHMHTQEQEKDRRKISTPVRVSTKANGFPFTRSLEKFTRSKNFYLYVVSTPTPDGGVDTESSPLEWSEVSWKDLVVHWGRETTFPDLLKMSTPLGNGAGQTISGGMQKKLVLHCLPKAASTTLRRACYKNMKENCEAIDFPRQQDPFGYRDIEDFFRAVKECTDIDHFCVQGGDAEMSIINNEESVEDREPYHFVHMVPFRKFDDWVESAIKQIYVIDGNCDRIDKLLDHCFGYRELYMELYPKSVLQLLTGMTFDANGKELSSKDKHHILLYNYKDVDQIVTEVSDFFDLDALPRTDKRHKEVREEGTCPSEISKKFHACHDETLNNADAIRGLKGERNRRRKEGRAMKQLLNCMKNGNCDEVEARIEDGSNE